MPSASERCSVLVDMPEDVAPDWDSWFDMWGAAVAVNTMCLKHGMQGRAVYLGQDSQITLSVGSPGYHDKGNALASS